MQPTRRHVPPSSGSLSMQTDLAPSWAARIAAVYPPGPPPRTATSHSIVLSLPQSISSVDPTGVPMGTALSAIGWDMSGGCHRPWLIAGVFLGQVEAHRPGAVGLLDLLEPLFLEDVHGGAVVGDAEAEAFVALLAREVDERREELGADPVATPARHDRDRNLRRLLVDEAEAGLVVVEQPVPRGPDGKAALQCDHGGIAASPPPGDVAPERGVLDAAPRAPVERMAQHVLQEADVLAAAAPNHAGAARRAAPDSRLDRTRPAGAPRCESRGPCRPRRRPSAAARPRPSRRRRRSSRLRPPPARLRPAQSSSPGARASPSPPPRRGRSR